MTYPIQQLAIIAPILFIVLVAVCPIIGFFGGWKRAAYWGGGNLLFYLAGVITWRLAGTTIAATFAPMIQNLLQQYISTELDLVQLTNALIPPIFFLIVVAAGNLLLVINYYAWFKRVSGISADIKIKKAVKFNKWAAKKEGNKQANTAVEIQTQKGVVLKSKTNKQKIINGAVGAVAMTALMLPGTITFTNAVFYATTTSSTRSAAGYEWVNNMYNAFDKLDKKMGWFSYYNGETGDAFNSLLSGLQLAQTKTTEEIEITDPNTGEPMVDDEGNKVTIPANTEVITIVTETVPQTVQEVVTNLPSINWDSIQETYTDALDKPESTPEKATQAVNKMLGECAKPVNKLAATWNGLVDYCAAPLQAVFNSNAVTDLINQYLDKLSTQNKIKLSTLNVDEDIMTKIFGEKDAEDNRNNGLFTQILNQYLAGEGKTYSTIKFTYKDGEQEYNFEFNITYIHALAIKASAIENIKSIAMQFVEFDENLSDKDKEIFNNAVDKVVSLILQESK